MTPLHSFLPAGALAAALMTLLPTSGFAFDLTIRDSDGSERAVMTIDDLEALGTVEITTATPWTEGVITFSGVAGDTFVEAVAPESEVVRAIALDQYMIEIPTDVLRNETVVIATRMDGEAMEPATKGPFWIMFDFDGSGVEKHAEYRNYSVWQLVEVELD